MSRIASVCLTLMALASVEAVYAQERQECFLESIQATFKAGTSTYRVEAGCQLKNPGAKPVPMHWSSLGTYDPSTGLAKEDVSIVTLGYTGMATTTLSCPSDPWLGPPSGPGLVECSDPKFQTSMPVNGNYDFIPSWFRYLIFGFLYDTYSGLKKEFSLPNSTGFSYDRAALIAQRDAVAKAEAAAALQEQNKRLQQGAPRVQPLFGPTIQLGTPGPPYLNYTSVPMRIAPPQGIEATGYLVRVESRNAQGIWTLVTHLPVSAAEASSPSGYLGWGASGPGRGANMIAGPGTYRVSAQVSAPRPTAWSQPVEFVVTAPSKAIQKAPKMFGQ